MPPARNSSWRSIRPGRCWSPRHDDGTMRLWNGATLEPIGPVIKMTGWIRCIAISPDGSSLAAGDQFGRLGFWDVRTGFAARPPRRIAGQPDRTGLSPRWHATGGRRRGRGGADLGHRAVSTRWRADASSRGRFDTSRSARMGRALPLPATIRPRGCGTQDRRADRLRACALRLCLARAIQSRRRSARDGQLRRHSTDLGRPHRRCRSVNR